MPAYWTLLAGLVAVASDARRRPRRAVPLIAFGLALIPFVFVALAFLSEHPRAPGAVVKAMVLALLVGIPVSALAADAVTGLRGGDRGGRHRGAPGRSAPLWKTRALAVLAVSAYAFVLGPVDRRDRACCSPRSSRSRALGVADHLSEREGRRGSGGSDTLTRFGHFDDAAREYVITRPDTPLPWINYLGSEEYFGLISNTAGGYSFYRDARLRRLTRYRYNNVPADVGGRYLYVRDDETGDVWSPSWQPIRADLDDYRCRHGLGYTVIGSARGGIEAETLYFVPLGETLEVWRTRVTNERDAAARLSLFCAVEFCLWDA